MGSWATTLVGLGLHLAPLGQVRMVDEMARRVVAARDESLALAAVVAVHVVQMQTAPYQPFRPATQPQLTSLGVKVTLAFTQLI